MALRTARLLHPKVRLYGLTRRVEDVAKLRAHGIVPIIGDLDRLASLDRLRAAPFAVLHFAPPPSDGRDDSRTRKLIAALARARSIPQRFVYISTSGVYGDCAGARVAETRPRRAGTPRARRRVAAEERLRDWAQRYGVALSILRVPGIYAETRLPLERIRQGTPALVARRRRLHQPRARRRSRARRSSRRCSARSPIARTTSATTPKMKMGNWFDAVADAFQLARPPRVSWEEAEQRIAPLLLSFMSESRRLVQRADEARAARAAPVSDAAAPARRNRAARSQEAARAAAVRRGVARAPSAKRPRLRTPTAAAIVARIDAYERLVRLDKPIGIALLLWPTLSALWLAAHGAPSASLVVIFTLGTILMRSAGCAVNDWADRRFDAHVERTAGRPLATGEIEPWEALVVGAALALFAFLLVLATNRTTIAAVDSGARASPIAYPFFKRFFVLPQAFLGIAFSFGIPMAYAAVYDARAGDRVVAAAAQSLLGRSPTTPSTRWSIATTTCASACARRRSRSAASTCAR